MSDSGRDTSQDLVAQPLTETGAFNWIFLIDWIVLGVLALFFLFYLNRLIGTGIAYLIRLYTWRTFRVYIDIEALQLSPLAGRIFLKGVRYHGDNETIMVQYAQITWRYWLPKTKLAQIFQSKEPATGKSTPDNISLSSAQDTSTLKSRREKNVPGDFGLGGPLPCRILVQVTGVEAFIYNRSPAYDLIVDTVEQDRRRNVASSKQRSKTVFDEKVGHGPLEKEVNTTSSSDSTSGNAEIKQRSSRTASSESIDMENADEESVKKKMKPPFFLQMFPIRVECQKAAAVLGNANTQSIVSAKVDSAFGEFDAGKSGDLDIFKILMSFEVKRPYIQLKPNMDFKQAQAAEGVSLKRGQMMDEVFRRKNWLVRLYQRYFKPTLQRIHFTADSVESVAIKPIKHSQWSALPFVNLEIPGADQWQGLMRYMDDGKSDEHDEWADVDYARSSVLADIPKIGFQFYWDIPGPVLRGPPHYLESNRIVDGDINGASPPEYGMKLIVHGGSVTYGPWADRQRQTFQQLFFPFPSVDSVPAIMIPVGQARLSTVFDLELVVREEVVLRIPFRESSKDYRWKGKASMLRKQKQAGSSSGDKKTKRRNSTKSCNSKRGVTGKEVRPFAWFDIKVKAPSTIQYSMDMYPKAKGYQKDLNVHVSGVDIWSSLNHALLWRSQGVELVSDLSDPLAWNGLREWVFHIDINRLDLFLLRDHTFLLVDLIEDWTRGPLVDFNAFVPFRYLLKVHFQDYRMYLNTNDANIIDNPEDIDDNEYIVLYGETLDADLGIPIDRFRPSGATIRFDVNSTNLGFEMCMPSKNTLNQLLADKNVATLRSVDLHGSYTNCSEVKPGITETMLMEIIGKGLRIQFYGFLARHLAKIKENYFGETVHFRTLDEYQRLIQSGFTGPEADNAMVKSNDLDVVLDIIAEDTDILLPSGMYSAVEHVRLHCPRADIDLRVNNYYLELMVNAFPLELNYTSLLPFDTSDPLNTSKIKTSAPQLFIDGLRFFGHRLFGLPPTEPAYVSNWDVEAGAIVGECVPEFVEKLVGAAQSLVLGISDAENAVPVPHYLAIPDSTFVRFACPMIRLWCISDEQAFLLKTKDIGGVFNDWSARLFSQRMNLNAPNIELTCVDAKSRSRDSSDYTAAYAYMRTSLVLRMVQRNIHFDEAKAAQQEHLRTHDDVSGKRAAFLVQEHSNPDEQRSISVPLPSLPFPQKGGKVWRLNDNPFRAHMQCTPFLQPDYASSELNNHQRQGSQPGAQSTHVFASPFKAPYLHLDNIRPDLRDVPVLEPQEQAHRDYPDQGRLFDDDFDENSVHTTFIVDLSPGVTAFCKPEAVRSVTQIIDRISPSHPAQLLDSLHFTTIMEVMATFLKKTGDNHTTEVSLRVPQIAVRFVNDFDDNGTKKSDRYNINMQNVAVAARFRSIPSNEQTIDSTAIHTTVQSIKFRAEEDRGTVEEAAFETSIDDILVWLTDGDHTSVHVSFRALEMSVESRKVEFLANLIYRTTLLASEFETEFERIAADHKRRLQVMMHRLVLEGDDMQDPLFLTRPSYVIRSSPDHVRNSDSWKIISKLHSTLRRMTESQREGLVEDCQESKTLPPLDAETIVLAKLDAWRAWDSLKVRESVVVRLVYGDMGGIQKMHDRSKIPVNVSVRSNLIRIVIDPGQTESGFSMDQMALGLSITPPPPPQALELFHDLPEQLRTVVVQMKMSKIGFALNWRIFDLVDQMLKLFANAPPSLFRSRDTSTSSDSSRMSETIHIIMSSDIAHFNLNALNASLEFAVNGLKSSVTGSGWVPGAEHTTVNALVSSKFSSIALSSKQRQYLRCRISKPSVWLAYGRNVHSAISKETLELAADSEQITLQTKEELLGFVELMHAILRDEASQLKSLIADHDKVFIKPLHPGAIVPKSVIAVRTTLFLNEYTLEVLLMPDLTYTTTGRTIRLALAPEANEQTYKADFDLKAQTHRLIAHNNDTHVESELQMPAINGTLQGHVDAELVQISALVSMESISLEGAAVHGIIALLTANATMDVFKAIGDDIIAVQQQAEQIFPKPTSVQTKPNAKKVLFTVKGAFAGIVVSADAPARGEGLASSNVLFGLRSVYFSASNQGAEDQLLPFPQFRAAVQEIALEVRIVEGQKLRLAGRLALGALFDCEIQIVSATSYRKQLQLIVTGPAVETGVSTAPLIVQVLSHLQGRMHGLDALGKKRYLRRLRHLEQTITKNKSHGAEQPVPNLPKANTQSVETTFSFELQKMRVSYIVEHPIFKPVSPELHDLVLSLESIKLLAQNNDRAQLSIKDLQLALVPNSQPEKTRPRTSALLPEVVFHVQHCVTDSTRRFAFGIVGQVVDIQIEPQFVLPINDLEKSLTISRNELDAALKGLQMSRSSTSVDFRKALGGRRLDLLTVKAEFAGALVQLKAQERQESRRMTLGAIRSQHGRYGQFAGDDTTATASLRAPGFKFHVQYSEKQDAEPNLDVELRVDGSSNVLNPSVVPLFLQVSDSIKKIVRDDNSAREQASPSIDTKGKDSGPEQTIVSADPRAILGKTRLNVGLRICKQEFSLNCQPIAKVAGNAKLDDVYITINTIDSSEGNNFFAVSAVVRGLGASLQHVYSRTITFSFDMESIVLSLMNSRHIGGSSGISVILHVNPTKTRVNAKQMQDILLFREIWLPAEIRHAASAATIVPTETQDFLIMQRYQQVAASSAFAWNATIAIKEIAFELDLGQSIGKPSFAISDFWVSSTKTSKSKQDLCVGVGRVNASSTGRLNGFVALEKVKVRMSILWPRDRTSNQAPQISASIGFGKIAVKAAFDYQVFVVVNITSFEFIMYNVKDLLRSSADRLVAILDGDAVHVYCIASAAAYGLSLYQAFERLVEEKKSSYEQALRETEKFLRRKSTIYPARAAAKIAAAVENKEEKMSRIPLSLRTDVIVTLHSLDVGAFPTTLLDNQVLRGEATEVQARFAVGLENNQIRSGLGMTLGQLRVALASIAHPVMPKQLGEVTIEDVTSNANASRGGVILRVPKVIASMQTWQRPDGLDIDYIFKSLFDGKIDVGWNYSRISFIRGMYETHSRTLANRLGKPLPEPAVKIRPAGPEPADGESPAANQQKLKAEVKLPQSSKYTYRALEPPIIDTPQLRDMGEATPPLEWVGLHRDRLPNVTHQIVIATLLELAKEVEDAYQKILGTARGE